MSHNRLASLPEDLLCKVSAFLTVKDVPVLLTLSKELNKTANTPYIFKQLIANSNNIQHHLNAINVDEWISHYRERKDANEIKAAEHSVSIPGCCLGVLIAIVTRQGTIPSLPNEDINCIINKKTSLAAVAGGAVGSLFGAGLFSFFSKAACLISGGCLCCGLTSCLIGCAIRSKQLRNRADRSATLSVPLIEDRSEDNSRFYYE